MNKKGLPSAKAVNKWLLETRRHSSNVEYYLHKLGIESDDPQRPHDIIGLGNKYEWPVLSGLALQYDNKEGELYRVHMIASREAHRQQYHHRMWNYPHPLDENKPNMGATEQDMFLGAVDAVCSRKENRPYNGDIPTLENTYKFVQESKPHQQEWIKEVVPEMKKIKLPPLHSIIYPDDKINIGLPGNMHDAIRKRTIATMKKLRDKYGYEIYHNTKL